MGTTSTLINEFKSLSSFKNRFCKSPCCLVLFFLGTHHKLHFSESGRTPVFLTWTAYLRQLFLFSQFRRKTVVLPLWQSRSWSSWQSYHVPCTWVQVCPHPFVLGDLLLFLKKLHNVFCFWKIYLLWNTYSSHWQDWYADIYKNNVQELFVWGFCNISSFQQLWN